MNETRCRFRKDIDWGAGARAQPATKRRKPGGPCAAAVHISARHIGPLQAQRRVYSPASGGRLRALNSSAVSGVQAPPTSRPGSLRSPTPERQRARGGAGPRPREAHSPAADTSSARAGLRLPPGAGGSPGAGRRSG
ncbi:hypothetical protein NDU88_003401 [Pleurodeles waltl]|uniref:Uncharacterized protein n=1 Tax=Pleurodeles waltl TaxID=8319 RepID=A0AAV7UCD4_PLEWA|nr:hypothetical protein NDU88_003401 [Pleurodeles waltl]